MSRTPGLDDIPLDVFRGVVAFGMGRFTVGRLDGGMKVCGPEFEAWTAHEERQNTARDLRALVGALGFHQLRCVSRQWRTTAESESACASGRRQTKNSKRSCRPVRTTISCMLKSDCATGLGPIT